MCRRGTKSSEEHVLVGREGLKFKKYNFDVCGSGVEMKVVKTSWMFGRSKKREEAMHVFGEGD